MPKNFIQQTEVMIGDYSGDHSFAIKYTTDAPARTGSSSKKTIPGPWRRLIAGSSRASSAVY
jgi:hypothetical protein